MPFTFFLLPKCLEKKNTIVTGAVPRAYTSSNDIDLFILECH